MCELKILSGKQVEHPKHRGILQDETPLSGTAVKEHCICQNIECHSTQCEPEFMHAKFHGEDEGLIEFLWQHGVYCITSTGKISLKAFFCLWCSTDLGNYFK